MAVVSRAERKRRRCDALARLTSGMGVSEVTKALVRDYGITRRSANLDINWASAQMIKSLEKYEKTEEPVVLDKEKGFGPECHDVATDDDNSVSSVPDGEHEDVFVPPPMVT